MVAKRKLTIGPLSKPGRRKLAELLIAEAAGNRQLTRTLNLAISAEEGPAALGASLGTRLATLAKSRWRSTLPISIGRLAATRKERASCVRRSRSARDAGLHHALGLTLNRLKRSADTQPARQ
jgi:hypothetical protein